MQRVKQVLAFVALAGLQVACGHNVLNASFGQRYHDIFTAQASERAAQPPQAIRGEEERRLIGAYYNRLAPDPASGGGGGGSGASMMMGGSSLSPISNMGSSFSSSSSNSGGGMDMRAR